MIKAQAGVLKRSHAGCTSERTANPSTMFVHENSKEATATHSAHVARIETALRGCCMHHFPLAISLAIVDENGATDESIQRVMSVEEIVTVAEAVLLRPIIALTVRIPPLRIVLFHYGPTTRERLSAAGRGLARAVGHFLLPPTCPRRPAEPP